MSGPCALFLNLGANGGRAAKRWEAISSEVERMLPQGTHVIEFSPPQNIDHLVKRFLDEGVRCFISAGGDGSANYLLNQLMQETDENGQPLYLGGIGLGSSNDFIKPKTHFIKGMPTRLNWENAALVDVGKAEMSDDAGNWQTRYFITNSSLGVTAEANWRFNHGDPFICFFKKRWTDLAILYTALRTISTFRTFSAQMTHADETSEITISNLAVLKSPYVSGIFRFDDPVQRDDGFFGVNICLDMHPRELIRTLFGLAKGQFIGRPKTMHLTTDTLTVRLQNPVALEMDGEIFQICEVRFSIVPKALNLLGL